MTPVPTPFHIQNSYIIHFLSNALVVFSKTRCDEKCQHTQKLHWLFYFKVLFSLRVKCNIISSQSSSTVITVVLLKDQQHRSYNQNWSSKYFLTKQYC